MKDLLIEIFQKNGLDFLEATCFVTDIKKVLEECPLHLAVEYGNLAIVKCLLENPIGQSLDIEAKDRLGDTAICKAALRGKVDIFDFLIKRGAKLNSCGEFEGGQFMLHLAIQGECLIRRHNSKMVAYLLENKFASVDHKDKNGKTPLHHAAAHLPILQILLQYPNADINAQDNEGKTVLACSLDYSEEDHPLPFLLQKGAYPDIRLKNGKSIVEDIKDRNPCPTMPMYFKLWAIEELFHFASGTRKLTQETLPYFKRSLELLTESEKNIQQSKTGNTCLHVAIQSKQYSVIVSLLSTRLMDIFVKNSAGENGLTLIQTVYPNDPRLVATVNTIALSQIEKRNTILKKQQAENKVETKERKETKENKETKERETPLLDYRDCINNMKSCLDKLPIQEKAEYSFLLGRKLSKRDGLLYSPVDAYYFLSHVLKAKSVVKKEGIIEVRKILLELLISRSVLFEADALHENPKAVPAFPGLDGEILESDQSKDHRLWHIIKHGFLSKTIHDDVMEKYIADYVGLGGVQALKGAQNKSIKTKLDLIISFKHRVQLLKENEQRLKMELQDAQAKNKLLEEKLKEMQEKLDKLTSDNALKTTMKFN